MLVASVLSSGGSARIFHAVKITYINGGSDSTVENDNTRSLCMLADRTGKEIPFFSIYGQRNMWNY